MPLIRDFNTFARQMRLKYIFADSKKTKPHPFHIKSKWQPQPQPSVALETYLELTKTELSEIVYRKQQDNLNLDERRALKELSYNKEVNLKKADKGSTTVIMNTIDKANEGFTLVSEEKNYKPLSEPIVCETAAKVNRVVNRLFSSGHIDKMTHKWLKSTKTPPRIPEFYTLTKIHKKNFLFCRHAFTTDCENTRVLH